MTRTITQHSRSPFDPIPNFLEWAIARQEALALLIAEQSAKQAGERK